MSKQDQATRVIEYGVTRGLLPIQIAMLLNMFELLAPDLPVLSSDYDSLEVPTRRTLIMDDADCPTLYENEDSILVGTVNGEVEFSLGVHDEVSVTLPVDKARSLAAALLAAANHAEEA